MITDEKIINRFMDKVLLPTVEGTCWIWTARLNNEGYGQFSINGKTHRAHRVSWEIFREEPLIDGLELDHICHCRKCINPAHLQQVPHSENMANLSEEGRLARSENGKKRGRKNRGENHGGAKLTEAQVLEIKELLTNTNLSQKEIGKMFGVLNPQISSIKTGRRWSHLTSKSTDAPKAEHQDSAPPKQIAKKSSTIYPIISG